MVLIHFDILHRGSRQFFEKLGDPESPLPDGLEQPNRALKYRTSARPLSPFRCPRDLPTGDRVPTLGRAFPPAVCHF